MTTQPTPIRKAINNIMEWHDFDKKEQVVGLLVELMQEESVRIQEAYGAGLHHPTPGATPFDYYIAKYGEIPSYQILTKPQWDELFEVVKDGHLYMHAPRPHMELMEVKRHMVKYILKTNLTRITTHELNHFQQVNKYAFDKWGFD